MIIAPGGRAQARVAMDPGSYMPTPVSTLEPIVVCREVTKTYGEGAARVPALRGVDLNVYPGELLMLVGPSGSGKTTLISVIASILDQDSGECRVLGEELQKIGDARRSRFRATRVGFVFQVFNLLPALTAAENVAATLLISGLSWKKALGRAREALDLVGLGDRWNARPGQLSGGQQQRVAIARAMVHDPKLILCDEPTNNLDHASGSEVLGLLRGVAQRPDRAVIVVTHDQRIYEYADRIARMDDGKIVEILKGEEKAGLQ